MLILISIKWIQFNITLILVNSDGEGRMFCNTEVKIAYIFIIQIYNLFFLQDMKNGFPSFSITTKWRW